MNKDKKIIKKLKANKKLQRILKEMHSKWNIETSKDKDGIPVITFSDKEDRNE